MRDACSVGMAIAAAVSIIAVLALTATTVAVFVGQNTDAFSSDISVFCFESSSVALFDGWLAGAGVCIGVLVSMRAVQLHRGYSAILGRVWKILSLLVACIGILAIPFLVLLCPMYYWVSQLAHFVFAITAIGLLYIYGLTHSVLYFVAVWRTRRDPLNHIAVSAMHLIVQIGAGVSGLVCVIVWAVSEASEDGFPDSILEWIGVFLIFVMVIPIALELIIAPCMTRKQYYVPLQNV